MNVIKKHGYELAPPNIRRVFDADTITVNDLFSYFAPYVDFISDDDGGVRLYILGRQALNLDDTDVSKISLVEQFNRNKEAVNIRAKELDIYCPIDGKRLVVMPK